MSTRYLSEYEHRQTDVREELSVCVCVWNMSPAIKKWMEVTKDAEQFIKNCVTITFPLTVEIN